MDIQLEQRHQSKGPPFLLTSSVTFGHIQGDCLSVGLVSRLSILMPWSTHLTMHCINCHNFITTKHTAFKKKYYYYLAALQSRIFIGRTGAEAETPILWPPDGKTWLIRKDPDTGKDWRQEEKKMTEYEMVEWQHQLVLDMSLSKLRELMMDRERGEWKSWLKAQHSEN